MEKKTSVRHLHVSENAVEQRLDNFLFKTLQGVPKSRIYRSIRKGEVRVNGKRIKAEYKLQEGDDIRIPPLQEKQPSQPIIKKGLIEQLQNNILFEDEYLLAINKPSGVPVHGGSGEEGGLIENLRHAYTKHQTLELVHRLDKGTSGCLLIAKKRSPLRLLHAGMRQGQFTKYYHLFVKGKWPYSKQLKVDVPLQRRVRASGERIVIVSSQGKPSKTLFTCEHIYPEGSLLQAHLITGRTHQIRVHAAHLGHPLAGDEKYGDDTFNSSMKAYGLKRLFLHASQLAFLHPVTKKELVLTAPLSQELDNTLKQLRKKL